LFELSGIDTGFGCGAGLTADGVFAEEATAAGDLAFPVGLSSTGAGTLLPKPTQPDTNKKVKTAVKRRVE
jgi:hypothetical protein